MIKKMLVIISLILSAFLHATELEDYVDVSNCDKVVDKQLYKICYSYKYKGALSGWVKLDGKKVNTPRDIKKRPRFYSEKIFP